MSLSNDQITAKNFKAFYEGIRPYLNGAAHSGFTPIGTVISIMGNSAPLNYLVCDGTTYNIADYPELAQYFYQQFEASNYFGGDGTTTFAVPDLRGEFLRGSGTNSHTGQGNGEDVGTHQDGTDIPNISYNANSKTGSNLAVQQGSGTIISPQNTDAVSSSTSSKIAWISTASEANSVRAYTYTSRPTNTSILFCIATKNIFMNPSLDYSTSEKVVGTWIDGKPLYQKTIVDTTPNGTTIGTISTKYINIGASIDYGTVVDCNIQNGSEYLSATYLDNDKKGVLKTVINDNTDASHPNTIIIIASRWFNVPCYATIQYTKTTD